MVKLKSCGDCVKDCPWLNQMGTQIWCMLDRVCTQETRLRLQNDPLYSRMLPRLYYSLSQEQKAPAGHARNHKTGMGASPYAYMVLSIMNQLYARDVVQDVGMEKHLLKKRRLAAMVTEDPEHVAQDWNKEKKVWVEWNSDKDCTTGA